MSADAVPGLPRDADGPVFAEPWEAQAFALAVALNERGLFTGRSGRRRSRARSSAPAPPATPTPATTYYRHWLAALERLVAEQAARGRRRRSPRYADAWGRAADRTPHGTPIELAPGDFG